MDAAFPLPLPPTVNHHKFATEVVASCNKSGVPDSFFYVSFMSYGFGVVVGVFFGGGGVVDLVDFSVAKIYSGLLLPSRSFGY